jgi:hypothetical protein
MAKTRVPKKFQRTEKPVKGIYWHTQTEVNSVAVAGSAKNASQKFGSNENARRKDLRVTS